MLDRLAADQLEGKPGLAQFSEWIKKKNLRRAAVTNAPRANAEQMIASCGLADFFEFVVVGSECERGKPFPDPYLKALKLLGIPASEAVVFEVTLAIISYLALLQSGFCVIQGISFPRFLSSSSSLGWNFFIWSMLVSDLQWFERSVGIRLV